MKRMKFSINSWIFGNLSIEEIARRAKEIGVDGIDVSGEPDTIDAKAVKATLDKYGLKVFDINGNFTEENRIMCHKDPQMRASAVEYGKKCVDMAVDAGTDKVLIVPSQVNKQDYYISREQDWKHSVDSIRQVAEYAKTKGVTIILECVNKYEVSLVRTLQDGIDMAKDTGMDNVKVIGDTFHMQLAEEQGIPSAIRHAGKDWLLHLHLGDNTREVPGRGVMNWRDIRAALDDIGYDEALSFEPLPHQLTLDEIFAGVLDPDELTAELKASCDYLKLIMQAI